uniref:Uncharacterized protein n=1 Tax=Chryseobacterium endophyticum TaxID=1854762 RepID=A0AAU6WJI9_9FLAO
MKIVGILTLIFGATSLFFKFQKTLNKLWDVVAAPKKPGKNTFWTGPILWD